MVSIEASGRKLHSTGTQDLSRAKQSRGPGDTVTFTFRRGHDVHTVEIALIDSELPN